MTTIWVVNASPLIAMAKAGVSDLLIRQADGLRIPAAVAAEVVAGPEGDPARLLLESGFGVETRPSGIPGRVLEWGLGPGESAVVAEAIATPGAEAVLDDAAARRCARSLGVPVIGTLGIVVRAKRAGLVSEAAPCLAAIRDAGLYFDDGVARTVLRAVGEEW